MGGKAVTMNIKEEFRRLKKYYDENDFEKLLKYKLGVCFLKIRSISRAPFLRRLANKVGIDVTNIPGKDLFKYLFCKQISEDVLDKFLIEVYNEERQNLIQDEDQLYSQLYKVKVFDWGGFYQNAVEQTIVNNYVKKIRDYNVLVERIENDINPRIRGYIICSWYNHWTSILIEDMIKRQPNILPASGLVKKIDFFWFNFPFDLKVTYFPDEYLQIKRKELGLDSELTELKKFARRLNINYDRNARNREVFEELLTRISEHPSREAKEFIKNFHSIRRKIIKESINNPIPLICWFYENQGIRRFDAANRFFIVLADLNNLEESWKLKRNKELLKSHIDKFFRKHKEPIFENMKITFNWQDREYSTYATILFIVKDDGND